MPVAVKQGVTKLVPESSKLPPKPLATLAHMHALFDGLDMSNAFDAAVWGIASVAFWSCCRLGELVVPTASKFDPQFHATRGTGVRFGHSSNGTQTMSFRIRWSETSGFRGAKIIGVDNDEITSSVLALQHHLRANSSIPAHVPLFAYETTEGTWAHMTCDIFLRRCNSVWRSLGFDELSGHCFCVGGTTEYVLHGTAPEMVQALGRWCSQAFMDYWWKIDSILPTFLSGSVLSSRHKLLRSSTEKFRRKHGLSR
ncbi:hypothetical protein D9615_005586 [Tricholomella constricta]|uniref:Uncharacterized protein n=1 Tax=Tricholomella constricta TaxID=117010 RepID=A0A8H5HEF7_9AGAR|nr:hypothetical protein D9615_005586 [Tricholomella constricta]